jgi:hypothetical protein
MKKWENVGRAELAAMYRTKTTKEIAALFGLHDETVRKKMVKLGIQRRKRGSVREFAPPKAELEAIYQQHSMREVSRIYGVGETVVWKRLKEYGIKLKDYEDGGHRKKPGRVFSKAHRRNLSKPQLARRCNSCEFKSESH